MAKKEIGVIIIGGTGYGAKEFLRLAQNHPEMDIAQVVSNSSSNLQINEIHPNLSSYSSLKFSEKINLDVLTSYNNKFIVLALPPEHSAQFIKENIDTAEKNNIKLVDLSGCCRIKNKESRIFHYPESESINSKISNFQYGLPELYREAISKCTHISNPGCYATSSILSIAPFTSLNIDHIIIDGKSGSSGAGKSLSPNFHHPELSSDAFAYKIGTHRHQAEIYENINCEIEFVPHVIPISRGMLTTSYIRLKEKHSEKDILDKLNSFYVKSSFITIKNSPPHIKDVIGSNYCHLYCTVKGKNIIVVSAIDNLVKGMAGQAIQNINIMCGLNEGRGISHNGLGLV